eukprot:TRINITY_DN22761_c0_g1_i1.p1 TRINITY_DN22761_c0_g1~~TRINITY_DN22761_c0_g1_i1.p1  ORF type:complete len:534 (+),score=56.36 TRINITY_DN22761_c0_g1_i1:23-1624(+)
MSSLEYLPVNELLQQQDDEASSASRSDDSSSSSSEERRRLPHWPGILLAGSSAAILMLALASVVRGSSRGVQTQSLRHAAIGRYVENFSNSDCVNTSDGVNTSTSTMPAVGLIAPHPMLPINNLDELVDLGEGACINQAGEHFRSEGALRYQSILRNDGSSPECERMCLSIPSCTGYQVENNSCFVIADSIFRPSSARGGSNGTRCFWRHPRTRNTSNLYTENQSAIPKIIWTFWQNVDNETTSPIPAFIDACLETMRATNPNYEVRRLNETEVSKWLDPEDLPVNWNDLHVEHRSDVIRLALLVRYGGVWADASTVMTHPMDQLLGSDKEVRTFFGMQTPWVDASLRANDTRSSWKDHPANWFMSAPLGDVFTTRVRDCVWQFMRSINRKDFTISGMFSSIQLDMMRRLGINAYLSSDACMFRTIDEDVAMYNWYHGNKVRIISPLGGLGFSWMVDMQDTQNQLFHKMNETFGRELLDDPGLYMKFTGTMRKYMVEPVSPYDIWCKENTFRMVLDSVGVSPSRRCATSLLLK